MTWRLLTSIFIVAVVAAGAVLVQAAPQGGRGARGAQRTPTQEVAPCFRTEIPAHPYDIILGRPTQAAVTVSVLATAASEGYVEWGTQPGVYGQRTEPVQLPAGKPVEFVLTPLVADTAYTYRLQWRPGAGDFSPGPEYRFHTARAPGSSFTFTVIADSHLDERTDPALYALTLKNALASQPDFHVDLGDTFMGEKVRGLGRPIGPMYLAQRYYFGLLCSNAPLFFAIGNHDGECGAQDPEARALRRTMLANPVPDGFYTGNEGAPLGNYYAWTWGPALCVVLDPFTYSAERYRTAEDNWNRTLGETQYRWLQRTLAGSRAPLKFVFIHHLVGGADRNARGGAEAVPFFEWGGHGLGGADEFAARRPGWGLPIHQLLVQHGVSAVFHGHDHIYARQTVDGIVYQEVPQPGWVGGETANQAAEYGYRQGTILPSSGHLRVDVSPARATVSYVRAYLPSQEAGQRRNGSVSDTYELLPRQ